MPEIAKATLHVRPTHALRRFTNDVGYVVFDRNGINMIQLYNIKCHIDRAVENLTLPRIELHQSLHTNRVLERDGVYSHAFRWHN